MKAARSRIASRRASWTSTGCSYLDHRRRRGAAIRRVEPPLQLLETRPFASGAAPRTRRNNSSAPPPRPLDPRPSWSTASPSARPHSTAQQLFLAAEYKRPRCRSLAFEENDLDSGTTSGVPQPPSAWRREELRSAARLRRRADTHRAGGWPRAAMARPPVHRAVVANSFGDDELTAALLLRLRTRARPRVATRPLRWTSCGSVGGRSRRAPRVFSSSSKPTARRGSSATTALQSQLLAGRMALSKRHACKVGPGWQAGRRARFRSCGRAEVSGRDSRPVSHLVPSSSEISVSPRFRNLCERRPTRMDPATAVIVRSSQPRRRGARLADDRPRLGLVGQLRRSAVGAGGPSARNSDTPQR